VKLAIRSALALGLLLLAALIARQGAASIVTPLLGAGAILLWIVPLHGLPILLDVLGWRELLPAGTRLTTLLWIAVVREAFNRLLPVANIGGEIVGVRLLAQSGTPTATAAASIVVELLLTLATQYLFVTVGVVCLVAAAGRTQLGSDLILALVISLPMILFLMVLVRYGSIFQRLARLGECLLGARFRAVAGDNPAAVESAIRRLYGSPRRLSAAAGWQFSGLIAGTAETWLVLRWFGHPVPIGGALALESLSQAARHFIFLVPAGIGVQEASLVAIAHVLGVGNDLAIALSLAKRMREILFGSPALLLWYWKQGRGHWPTLRNRGEA
jgi:putative membrane protein